MGGRLPIFQSPNMLFSEIRACDICSKAKPPGGIVFVWLSVFVKYAFLCFLNLKYVCAVRFSFRFVFHVAGSFTTFKYETTRFEKTGVERAQCFFPRSFGFSYGLPSVSIVPIYDYFGANPFCM